MKKHQNEETLFWIHLLYPLIFDEIERGERKVYLRKIANQEHVLPNGKKKKVSISTLKRKLKRYREQGLEGFQRDKRSDKGQIKATSQEILEEAIRLKTNQPLRSHRTINEILQERYGQTISKTTLYRHLKAAGATKTKLGINKQKVRKRWSRNNTHDLWCGDFSWGPTALIDGKVSKTYLSVFIDCFSRHVVAARYYSNQTMDVLIDTLLRAWDVHGCSRQLYVDNAKVYHAKSLVLACTSMGIKLIHRPVRDPAAGGIIERMIFSIQQQFESEVRALPVMNIDELNRALVAWLDVSYHDQIHSETKQTPKQRYEDGLKGTRPVDIMKALQFFMKRENRTVDRIFSDVRVDSKFYRVDPKLRGDRVQVLIDPFGRRHNAVILSLDDVFLGEGVLHQRKSAPDVTIAPPKKVEFNYLQMLIDKHEKSLNKEIDYTKIEPDPKLPFLSFVQMLSNYLGHKGGVSSFTSNQHDQLMNLWEHPKFCESLVVKAWKSIPTKNFSLFVVYLNQLYKEK